MANYRNQRQRQSGAAVPQRLARQQEEIPMKRYVNTIPLREDEEDLMTTMKELNQILDHQNQILARLLEAVEGREGKSLERR
jgi:hypothetical protein